MAFLQDAIEAAFAAMDRAQLKVRFRNRIEKVCNSSVGEGGRVRFIESSKILKELLRKNMCTKVYFRMFNIGLNKRLFRKKKTFSRPNSSAAPCIYLYV